MLFYTYFILELSFATQEGFVSNFYLSGVMVFGIIVVIVNFKVLIISYEHSVGTIIFNIGSMIMYLLNWVTMSYINYSGTNISFSIN